MGVMPLTAEEFRTAVRALRGASRLTQAKFAERVGVAVPTVGRWEIAANAPERESVQKIIEAFRDDPVLHALAVNSLSEGSEMVPSAGAPPRGRYTVKYPETEIVAKMIDAVDDDAARYEMMERITAELRRVRRHPRKAERG